MNHPVGASHTFVPCVVHGGIQARALIKPARLLRHRAVPTSCLGRRNGTHAFGLALPDHVTAFTSTPADPPCRGCATLQTAALTATAVMTTMMSLLETS